MSCYRPIRAWRTAHGVVFSELSRYDILGRCDVPCGRCTGCLERRASDWALRIMHEAQMWEDNCFVTLTYGRDQLPPGGFLEYRDFQLFMKRMRKRLWANIRFFMCGEYGPLNLRPHYHACLFNVAFPDKVVSGKSGAGAVYFDSPLLSELWSHGRVSVQELNHSTAMYCARYVVKKQGARDDGASDNVIVDADGVVRSRPVEFCHCSLKPGIGAGWYGRFSGDFSQSDRCVIDGVERSVPKYYDKLRRRAKDISLDEVEFRRAERARLCFADNTDERLRVREVVHEARLANLRRELDD